MDFILCHFGETTSLISDSVYQFSCFRFDELHFGRSAAMYLRNTFHFDVHPPLGTMMMALAGYYAGYSGDFKFDKIGAGE